jgi:enamine deaminase RidA (YjgF/YER057c/UK114 family)
MSGSARRIIEVPGWKRPKGYSNGVAATGELVFVAGQIGWDAEEKLVSDEFLPQFAKALENVKAVLEAAGAEPKHIVRMTLYVTDKTVYRAAAQKVGEEWRRVLGKVFPAMSLVQVADLLEEGALVEIEATAVIPAS